MTKGMVIQSRHGKTFHLCPSRIHWLNPEDDIKEEVIPTFYSEQNAMKEGWVKTDHIKYCPPDRDFVWVCPECANKENWRIKNDSG